MIDIRHKRFIYVVPFIRHNSPKRPVQLLAPLLGRGSWGEVGRSVEWKSWDLNGVWVTRKPLTSGAVSVPWTRSPQAGQTSSCWPELIKKKGGGALHGEPRGLNDFCPWHPHFPSPAKVTCPGLSEPVLAPRPSQSLTPDLCDTSRWVNGAPSPPERIKSPRPPLASYDRGLSLSALLKRYPSTRPRASQPPAQLTFEFAEIRLAPPPPRSALHTPAPPELFWRKVAGGKLQLVKSL